MANVRDRVRRLEGQVDGLAGGVGDSGAAETALLDAVAAALADREGKAHDPAFLDLVAGALGACEELPGDLPPAEQRAAVAAALGQPDGPLSAQEQDAVRDRVRGGYEWTGARWRARGDGGEWTAEALAEVLAEGLWLGRRGDGELTALEAAGWAELEIMPLEVLRAHRPPEHLTLPAARKCACARCADLVRWADIVDRKQQEAAQSGQEGNHD